jgi:hypothetical protein
MDKVAIWEEILEARKTAPSLPARRARDLSKAESAEVRSDTAWHRVMTAISGLRALLILRDELRSRERELFQEIREHGFDEAPVELFEAASLRQTQRREVLIAYLSQGKVLLDLLAQAVAETLGNPGRFKAKHGNLGVRLDEFAAQLGVGAPSADLVDSARRLDQRIADLRDDVIVHPKLTGEHARKYLMADGDNLSIHVLFPDGDDQRAGEVIPVAELDAELEAYTRDLVRWVASVLVATSTA